MTQLNLPTYPFRVKKVNDKDQIFDAFRKKWVSLTPEEWVRQNFIQYLVAECGFVAGKIGIEVGLTINGRKLRADAVVYDPYGELVMLLEFKAPHVAIDEKVFSQVADYNTKLGAKYIAVTNGLNHYFAKVEGHQVKLLSEIPQYSDF